MTNDTIIVLGGIALVAVGLVLISFRKKLAAFAAYQEISLRGLPGKPSKRYFFWQGVVLAVIGIGVALIGAFATK